MAESASGYVRPLTADRDDELLVTVLDEVTYLLDTAGDAQVDVEVNGTDGGVEATFAMADAGALPQVGAVPKAVSFNERRLAREQASWRCSVALDV
jgi:protein archease